MTVLVCLDDRNGMQFNGRRQSRDRVVSAHLLEDSGGALYVAPWSVMLFPPETALVVTENVLEDTPEESVCFVETPPLSPAAPRIHRLIVYRWNRVYPADAVLDLQLDHWTLREQTEFPGNSHPKITREVYEP